MTAHTATERHRPPSAALGGLIRLEARMTWREPAGLLAGLVLPVFFLVVFSTVPTFEHPAADPRFTIAAYLVPLWICMAVSIIALLTLPIPLARDREIGWLRRVSTTPVPPQWLLAARAGVDTVMAVVAVAVLTLGSVAFFGMAAPGRPAGYVLAAVLLIAAMFAIGLLVAAVAPSSRAAAGLGTVALYPLLFFGGLWVPRESMAPALRTVSDYTPLMAASRALRDAMVGVFPATSSLLVLAGWAVVCGLAAVRSFRWE